MGTYAIYSLIAVVPTGLLLILRLIFVYVLCRMATKERRPITISSAHPLAINVNYPIEPAPRRQSKPVVAALPNSKSASDSAHETKLAS
jgi:hypothetical protein